MLFRENTKVYYRFGNGNIGSASKLVLHHILDNASLKETHGERNVSHALDATRPSWADFL